MSKIRKVTLREKRTEKDVSILEAYINDDGDLVLEGYDVGEAPKQFWGDSDYEYVRMIKSEHKRKILNGLIGEQFSAESDFKAWLDSKGIPSGSFRLIKGEYRDTIMLLLLKERFDTDSDFKSWLDGKGIPSEFWNWV
jgi:hypothetical protein